MNQFELNTADAWCEYYSDPSKVISAERINLVKDIHLTFLQSALEITSNLAIEVGVGTGSLGHTLSLMAEERGKNLDVIEIDYSLPLLMNSRTFNGNVSMNFIAADTFSLPLSAESREKVMIFHQGLLEHFNDDEINLMLSEQLRVASTVLATVPSHLYAFKEGLRGDERLMNLDQWKNIIGTKFDVDGYYYGRYADEQYHICLCVKEKPICQ